MRRFALIYLLLLMGLILTAWTNTKHRYHLSRPPIDLDVQTSGKIYRSLLAPSSHDAGELQPVLDMGARNLDWLNHINEHRPVKLSFSSKDTEIGHPIERPSIYNAQIVLQQYQQIQTQIPKEMLEVIFHNAPFTDNPPIADAEYLKWGLEIDRIYQSGSRWLLMQPYLGMYALRRQEDIRGYYFLQKEADLTSELANWSSLPVDKRSELAEWLKGMCFNSTGDDDQCASELTDAEKQTQIPQFYARYLTDARDLYNSFFEIAKTRDDIHWTQNQAAQLDFPFTDPNNSNVANFLKSNIEDEWKWAGWNLIIDFMPTAETHVEFQAGTTPHVNAVAGNIITMDANAPLTEYDVQWTIRHEFGHVLGFVDCYVEYYDEAHQWMVDYQLDINNLMCSRRGHLLQTHYDELKQAYLK